MDVAQEAVIPNNGDVICERPLVESHARSW